jgi:GNAT superfamily N-acetyltransferase
MTVGLRLADMADVERVSELRLAVRQNVLLDRSAVTLDDYRWFVSNSEIWVAVVDGRVVGFSAGDPRDGSIWALFVEEQFEGRGFGQALIEAACGTLRRQGHVLVKLTTEGGTRAEHFYRTGGWKAVGVSKKGEIVFEKELEPLAL